MIEAKCHRCKASPASTLVIYNHTGAAEPTCIDCAVEAFPFIGPDDDQLMVVASPTIEAYLDCEGGIQ